VFNKSNGLNSIENVEETGLREVLTYMSWEAATTEYEVQYQKVAERAAKNKGGGMNY